MTTDAEIIVVGTGGVGSAALYHLASRGVRVLGIDRFPGGHDRGSSHGHSRISRLAYFEHPDYEPLLRRAYDLWAELERMQVESLLLRTGLLEVGPPKGPTIRGVLAAASQHRLVVEELSPDECRRCFPGFVVPDGSVAVFEAQAGVLRVERCVLAHLEQARRSGASAVFGESVLGWTATSSGVEVTTDKNVYRAGGLVVTAGPWAGELLGSLRVPLQVRRKHLHWYPGPAESYAAEFGCPAFLFETGVGDFYGIPAFDGYGLKAGEHSGGAVVADPLVDDRSIDMEDRRRVETFLETHLPRLGRPASDHRTCFYTISPDCHFVVDRHPEHANVAFAAGLSGHGFKFTGVLGEALADLVTTGRTELPIGFAWAGAVASPGQLGVTISHRECRHPCGCRRDRDRSEETSPVPCEVDQRLSSHDERNAGPTDEHEIHRRRISRSPPHADQHPTPEHRQRERGQSARLSEVQHEDREDGDDARCEDRAPERTAIAIGDRHFGHHQTCHDVCPSCWACRACCACCACCCASSACCFAWKFPHDCVSVLTITGTCGALR